MGLEVAGTVTVGGQKVPIQADFGSDRVRLSGGKRGDVPYKQVEVVSTTKGILKLRVDGTPMEFPIGATVDRLANKIRKPPSRAEKMGIKPGQRAHLVGPIDRSFVDELRAILPKFGEGRPRGKVDLIVYAAKSRTDLDEVAVLASLIEDDGAVWVVYKKGKRDPSEDDVLLAGRKAGLKDIKVARFSETHTALKFVVPLADRDPSEPQRGVRGVIKPDELAAVTGADEDDVDDHAA